MCFRNISLKLKQHFLWANELTLHNKDEAPWKSFLHYGPLTGPMASQTNKILSEAVMLF